MIVLVVLQLTGSQQLQQQCLPMSMMLQMLCRVLVPVYAVQLSFLVVVVMAVVRAISRLGRRHQRRGTAGDSGQQQDAERVHGRIPFSRAGDESGAGHGGCRSRRPIAV